MNRFVQAFFMVLALALLFILGAQALLQALGLQWEGARAALEGYTWTVRDLPVVSRFAFAALALLLPVFVALLALQGRRADRIIRARDAAGDSIHMTEGAVRRCLNRALGASPEVAAVATETRNGKTGPRVVVRTLLWAGADVPATQRQLRSLTAATLRRLFGVGEIEEVRVIVAGLRFRDRNGAIRSRPGAAAPAPAPRRKEGAGKSR